MFSKICSRAKELDLLWPDHIFLQAGYRGLHLQHKMLEESRFEKQTKLAPASHHRHYFRQLESE